MKTKNFLLILSASFLMAATSANAQLNVQKAKDKITTKANENKEKNQDNKKNETMGENTNSGSASGVTALEPGKGYFYTSFKSNDFKNEVGIGDELYVRMELGKTMIDLSQEHGLGSTSWAYGYVTVYIDGNKQFTTKPYSFASNISKDWTFINIPLNISPDFISKLESDQSMLETSQDIWVFQQLFQEKGIVNLYTEAAMKTMASGGNHTVKVEFGLSDGDSKSEPDFVACSGEVKISVDAAGADALAQKGPKNLRPLSDSEKGKFVTAGSSFTIGSNDLTMKLELPQTPKYYNMKWCKATSCDYDHGDLNFYLSVDNQPVCAWSTTFWEADYENRKSFEFMVLPKTDNGINTPDEGFNDNILFKHVNPVVYNMFDLVYGGKLSAGTHKLKIKVYSPEVVPYDVSYEYQDSYFSQWPPIAETEIDIVVTEQGRNTMISSSEAKKLSHAGGEWASVDSKLLSGNTGNPEIKLIDVATTSEWKVTTNSLGAILYRTCHADVIYKCDKGYRLMKSVSIKEDYSGGGSYGSPYFNERIDQYFDLSPTHVPVPEAKIK
ncbi:hypothetical protein SDC9_53753 [bioreactor metagenome]|uniref:Uncharacterized protein n=1 Tax=bioreactor metagenome TaxID=1076179 RepID=A0A644WUS6_9ZZZZ